MSDLISREALKEEMVKDLANTMRMMEMHKGDMAVRVLNKIDEAPAVDAVEVVRCKDCKHCFPAMIPLCDAEGGLLPIAYNIETWFCPLGERKEDAVD